MRLIIFRGKRTDNGAVVEGYLTKKMVFRNKSNDGVLVDAIVTAVYYNEDREVVEEWHEVDKNTIGQYTGLKDCNSTEIYEGDILSTTSPEVHKEVYWEEEDARYLLRNINLGNYTDGGALEKRYVKIAEMVVIGNKYDNPELLN